MKRLLVLGVLVLCGLMICGSTIFKRGDEYLTVDRISKDTVSFNDMATAQAYVDSVDNVYWLDSLCTKLDTNGIYLIAKVGDKYSKTNYKDGDAISYIDVKELIVYDTVKADSFIVVDGDTAVVESNRDTAIIKNNSDDFRISPHMKKVYSIVKLPRNKKAFVTDTLLETLEKKVADPSGMKQDSVARTYRMDWDSLAKASGIIGYEDSLRDTLPTDIVDLTALKKYYYMRAKTKQEMATKDTVEVKDVNVVTSGSYTVGSGGDYATWNAAIADIGNLTGNLTFTQISDVTETSASLLTETLGGFTLRFTSNTGHKGDPNKGWVTTWTIDNHMIDFQPSGGGTIEVDSLVVVASANKTAGVFAFVFNANTVTSTGNFHDNIIDGASKTNTRGFAVNDADWTLNAWNNVVTDCDIGYWSITASTYTIENNTILNSASTGFSLSSNAGTYTNNVSVGAGSNDFFNMTAATGNNNASSDTTAQNSNWTSGTNNVVSVTAANEFISQASDDWNLGKLKSGGSLDSGGTTTAIAGNTTGIRGNARPTGTNVSIGADQFDATTSISYTVGTSGDFATFEDAFSSLPATFTGDATLTQISDVTETGVAISTSNLNGKTLTITSDTPHNGDVNKGHITNIAHNNDGFDVKFTGTGSTTFEMKNLYIKRTVAGASNFEYMYYLRLNSAGGTYKFHDLLCDQNGLTGSGPGYAHTGQTMETWNVVVWDGWNGVSLPNNAITPGTWTLENISVYNVGNRGFASFANFNGTIRNCYATGSASVDYIGVTSATGRNNASGDTTAQNANWGTGTGNITSLTVGNEVVSIVDDDWNFFKAKDNGSIDSGGVAPTISGNTTGIRGNARPTGTNYSIGADQFTADTHINYDVGTGGDFIDWEEAFTAFPANFTGTCTLNQVSAFTMTTQALFDDTLNGNNLVLRSNSTHNGDPTSGYITSINIGNNRPFLFKGEGTGIMDIQGLYIKRIDTPTADSEIFLPTAASNEYNLKLHDILYDGNGKRSSFILMDDGGMQMNIWNCVIWDVIEGTNTAAIRLVGAPNASTTVENITLYDCDLGIRNGNAAMIWRQFAVFNVTDPADEVTGGSTRHWGTDGSGTGFSSNVNAKLNLVDANEFVDTLDTSADFMRVKCGGSLADSGEGPATAGDTQGIRGSGFPRPHNVDKHSIGADELFFSSPETTATDTAVITVCLSLDSLVLDSISVDTTDSICGLDTTVVVMYDTFYTDTTFPTVIKVFKATCGDSVNFTVSACPPGDTTAIDTFFVNPATFDTTYRDSTFDTVSISPTQNQIIYADSQQIDSIRCGVTTSNYIVNFRDSIFIDTIVVAAVTTPTKSLNKNFPVKQSPTKNSVYKQAHPAGRRDEW